MRVLDRPLQSLLPADGTSDDRFELSHPEVIQEPLLRPHHIPDGDDREPHPIRASRFGVDRSRACTPGATTEYVGADDEVLVGVDGAPRPDHRIPPAAPLVRLGDPPGAVRVARERVDDEHGVFARMVQLAPSFVGERDLL